jgi:hypothetical protein
MKTAWLIFKKDASRFRLLLLAWGGLLILDTLLSAGAISLDLDKDNWGLLVTVGRWLSCAVIPILFIQEDGLTGDREMWMSRPIAPGAWLGGKLLGLIVWLVLPSLAALTAAALWLGVDVPTIEMACAGCFLVYLTGITVVAAFAGLTANIVQWGLAVVAMLGLFLGAISIDRSHFLKRHLQLIIQKIVAILHLGRLLRHLFMLEVWHHSQETQQICAILAACLFGLAILTYQVWFRRRGRSVILLLLGAVVIWHASVLWPWQDLPWMNTTERAIADQITVEAPAQRNSADGPRLLKENVQQPTGVFVPHERLLVPFNIHGLPLDHIFSRNGFSRTSSSHFVIGPRDYTTYSAFHYDDQNAVRALRGILGWQTDPSMRIAISYDYFQPPDGIGNNVEAVAGKTGRLDAVLTLAESRMHVMGEMPLREGAQFRGGGVAMKILTIEEIPIQTDDPAIKEMLFDGVMVKVDLSRLVSGEESRLIIINRVRHELPPKDGIVVLPHFSPLTQLNRSEERSYFTWTSPKSQVEADAWLKEASVLAVAAEPIGILSKSVSIANFTIPQSAAK